MKSKRFSITCALGLAIVFGVAARARATVHPPDFNPADFVHPITNPNPFFPLVPGTTFFYEGEKEGVATSNTTEVTCDTLVIAGVRTTIVHDRAFEGMPPVLVEDTLDYYAQNKNGQVWYFGEDTTEFDPITGEPISTEGTWREGLDDADAGFIMLAAPHVGDRYFQEFAPGVAEDQAKVTSLDGSACSPYTGCVDNLLVTRETSRLDPGVVENKYYASDIGFIRGEIVKGGDEFIQLVGITTGNCQP